MTLIFPVIPSCWGYLGVPCDFPSLFQANPDCKNSPTMAFAAPSPLIPRGDTASFTARNGFFCLGCFFLGNSEHRTPPKQSLICSSSSTSHKTAQQVLTGVFSNDIFEPSPGSWNFTALNWGFGWHLGKFLLLLMVDISVIARFNRIKTQKVSFQGPENPTFVGSG